MTGITKYFTHSHAHFYMHTHKRGFPKLMALKITFGPTKTNIYYM